MLLYQQISACAIISDYYNFNHNYDMKHPIQNGLSHTYHILAKASTYLLCEKNLLPNHSMITKTKMRPSTKAILPAIIVTECSSLSPLLSLLLVGVPVVDS